jgi:pre-rRNA-processing protein TSR3
MYIKLETLCRIRGETKKESFSLLAKNKMKAHKGGRGHGRKVREREIRTDAMIRQDNRSSDSGSDSDVNTNDLHRISVSIMLWEFGQNDPKRDSGSKMCRLGYARKLQQGDFFPGIVLSSEASVFVSPADATLVGNYGIAGINCSWNRLDEIPFGSMGKGKHQRLLPLLFAANTVNYGKPFKMNTAEAVAACLYITGYKEDAHSLMETFSYGLEFLRLNHDALEAYSKCADEHQVRQVNDALVTDGNERAQLKMAAKVSHREGGNKIGGYTDDMDLPPMSDSDENDIGEDTDGLEANNT